MRPAPIDKAKDAVSRALLKAANKLSRARERLDDRSPERLVREIREAIRYLRKAAVTAEARPLFE